MQEDINNKISQFVDDELDLQQALSLLKSVKENAELKNKLNRYQTISQALKSEHPVMLDFDFAERVSRQVGEEPVYFIPDKKSVITWKKTSLAVAASLAFAAVLLPKIINQQTTGDHSAELVVAERLTANDADQAEKPKLARSQVHSYSSNQRLNDYLQAHSNSIYTIGASNYQPYARVAGYNQGR